MTIARPWSARAPYALRALLSFALCVAASACNLAPRASGSAPARGGTLVVRSDLRHGVREEDPPYLGYSVFSSDGRLVRRSTGFSSDEDALPLAAGEYRVVAAPAGLFLDDPPEATVLVTTGRTTRLDLRRR